MRASTKSPKMPLLLVTRVRLFWQFNKSVNIPMSFYLKHELVFIFMCAVFPINVSVKYLPAKKQILNGEMWINHLNSFSLNSCSNHEFYICSCIPMETNLIQVPCMQMAANSFSGSEYFMIEVFIMIIIKIATFYCPWCLI